MPVKYQCPSCDKRFVDWGAAKFGFKCPDCEDTELVRLGLHDDRVAPPPTLKRGKPKRAKKVAEPVAAPEFEGLKEDFSGEDGELDGLTINKAPNGEAVRTNAEKTTLASEGESGEALAEAGEDVAEGAVPQGLHFGEDAPPPVCEA